MTPHLLTHSAQVNIAIKKERANETGIVVNKLKLFRLQPKLYLLFKIGAKIIPATNPPICAQ